MGNEPHVSAPDLVVLHTLRCCGFTTVERLETVIAPLVTDDADVEQLVLELAAQGLVRPAAGEPGGWGVTDAGRDADAERIALELDHAAARVDVKAAYDDFLALNQRTLDICGAWQVRSWQPPMVLNDHSDEVYDADVLGRLAAVDAAAQPVCARLASRLHRFAHYGPRLAMALARARQGEVDHVTDSLDSYHTVWFQLHEDLLVTLGINRWDAAKADGE